MTTDKEHLQWMLNRLAEVHGENRNVDYMVRMQKIIDSTETELNLHLVSERYFKIEFTNVWGSFKEAIVKATNKNTAYAEFKMKNGDQVNIIAVNDYAR
jgi:hypothetical protein